MTPWAVQIVTLLGVALGALASFVSTRAIERSRWRREETLRWDSKRLECYSDFSAAMIRFITIEDRIAAGIGLPTVIEPLDGESGLTALVNAEAAVSLYWAQLLILGGPEVVTAAQHWRTQAWLIESFARGHQSNTAEFEAHYGAGARHEGASTEPYEPISVSLVVMYRPMLAYVFNGETCNSN